MWLGGSSVRMMVLMVDVWRLMMGIEIDGGLLGFSCGGLTKVVDGY